MLTGGRIGDLTGRRRAFTVGLVICPCGSALTAVAPQLWVPRWSIYWVPRAARPGRAGGRELHRPGPGGRLRHDRRPGRGGHRGGAQIGTQLESRVTFVPASQVRTELGNAGVPPAEADAVVAAYTDAQLAGLKSGILVACAIALGTFWLTRRLPTARLGGREASAAAAGAAFR